MQSRRLLAIIVAAVFLTQQAPVHAAFTDLDGSPYEGAIMALAGEGIISGYPDGTTRPYGRLNRAEALKVAVAAQKQFGQELADTKSNMPTIALFADVDQRSWYAPYLEVAFSNQVITGYPDNMFRPYSNLKVEEAIAIVMRAFDEKGSDIFQTSPSIDNRPGQWFTPYVNAAIERDLIAPSDTLRLGTPITRGQFFSMVHRMRSPSTVVLSANQASASSQPSQVVYRPPVQQQSQPAVQQPQHQQYIAQQPYQQPQQPASVQSSFPVKRAQPTGVVDPASAMQFASRTSAFAIAIPSLGITDLHVIHPEDSSTQKGVLAPLSAGVGHLFAYPGDGSKIMIYGHSSSYPWDLSQYTKIFRTINKVNIGERIYVTYNGKLYVYEVVFKNAVSAKDESFADPDENGEELILYTCWPPDSIQQRYLVHAMPIDVLTIK